MNFGRSPCCSTARRAPSVIAAALDGENPAGPLHAERVSCLFSVGREVKTEIAEEERVQMKSRIREISTVILVVLTTIPALAGAM